MKINKLAVKSFVRVFLVAVGWVITATNTYLAAGHHFGLNMETLTGVSIQTGLVILSVVQRYLDKNDPAFGKLTDAAAAQLAARLATYQKPAA